MTEIIYSGIIPYSYNYKNKKTYVLMGYEESTTKKWDKGFSGFGGSPDKNETPEETAAREAYEESMGFLGDKKEIEKLIESGELIKETTNNGKLVYQYFVKIPYNHHLCKNYKNVYNYVKEGYRSNNIEIPDGYLEKKNLKWIDVENIENLEIKWRPCFKNVPEIISEYFKEKN